MVIWLIGISGAGKTTIGKRLEEHFNNLNIKNYLLDGDEVRDLFDRDLGYSDEEREANIKRIILGAYCQTAHCGRCKPHFDFGVIASPIVPYRNLPQAPDGMTADCRSLVSKAAGAAFEIRP